MRSNADFAAELDHADPLARFREAFLIPRRPDGQPATYFCGHSLGLQPRALRPLLEQELDDWARLGVEAHFKGTTPWYAYHEAFRDVGARLVGARPGEVVMMNSLTVNLHLMLVTFYRPRPGRGKILVDEPVFPSDLYALQSQLRLHGLHPADARRTWKPSWNGRATRSPWCCSAASTTSPASSSTCRRSRPQPTARAASPASTSPTRPATCRFSSTTGTWILPSGAPTST
jgi:kynureninase